MGSVNILLLAALVAVCVQYSSMQSGKSVENEASNRDETADMIEAIQCLKLTILNLTKAITELTQVIRLPAPLPREGEGEQREEGEEGEEEPTTTESPTDITQPSRAPPPPTNTPSPHICPNTHSPSSLCGCEGNGWRKLVQYNFTDTTCNCPAGWCQVTPPTRGCGRESHDRLTCDSVTFQVDGPYSEICGLVLGYQFGHTEAFLASNINRSLTIDDSYVTGVTITRGNPRQHVWTYAAGRYERLNRYPYQYYFCPCEHASDIFIPEFVGACWSCESGNNAPYGTLGYTLFSDDVLWDGEGCRYAGRCCQFDGPQCFNRALPEVVTDAIEVRICNYKTSQYSNVIVSHLELHVR